MVDNEQHTLDYGKKPSEQSEKLCELLVEASTEDDRFWCYKESLLCPLVAESGKASVRPRPRISSTCTSIINQHVNGSLRVVSGNSAPLRPCFFYLRVVNRSALLFLCVEA